MPQEVIQDIGGIEDSGAPSQATPAEEFSGFDIGSDLGVEETEELAVAPQIDDGTNSPGATEPEQPASPQSPDTPNNGMSPEEQLLRADPATLTPEQQAAQSWMRQRQGQFDRRYNELQSEVQRLRQQAAAASPDQISTAVATALQNNQQPADALEEIRQQIRQSPSYQPGDESSVDVVDRIFASKYGPGMEQQQQQIGQLMQTVQYLGNLVQTQQASALGEEASALRTAFGDDFVTGFTQENRQAITQLMGSQNPRTGQRFTYTEAFRALSGVGEAQAQVAQQRRTENRQQAKRVAAAPSTHGAPPSPPANGAPMSNDELLAAAERLPGILPRGS